MPPLRLIPLLLILAAALARADSAAAAGGGACVIGSPDTYCNVWKGKATAVSDGDTIDVDVEGDGTSRPVRVRVTGINAMEQTVYDSRPARRRGECHALEATARLERLLKAGRWRVRLAAQDPVSESRHRWRRSVAVKVRGRWRDAGRNLVAEGHALWLPDPVEAAWNRSYSELMAQAAAAGENLWDPDYCRPGPSEGASLRVLVNWDADGNDGENPAGEWISIRNLDPLAGVPLGGWWVRDSALRRYTFAPGVTMPPGGTITVYVGTDVDTPAELHWNLDGPIFDNATRDDRAMGDGAYLFDPQGDLRASMIYPCRVDCSDPNQGAFAVAVHPRGDEAVTVRNVATWPVDLQGYRLAAGGGVGYAFGPDSVLGPGEEMRVEPGFGDPAEDTRLLKHWETDGSILPDRRGRVRLATLTDILLGCDAWGDAGC